MRGFLALLQKNGPEWIFDYEGLWQFGTFGSGNIRAWTVASETGYRFPTVPLKPRFSTKTDISSGDNPRSKTLGTFNPLFPKGNYFGVLATTGPGPLNFMDVHPHVETTFPHNVTASVDWIFQWRQNVLDGVYSVPGSLIKPAIAWRDLSDTGRARSCIGRLTGISGFGPTTESSTLEGS